MIPNEPVRGRTPPRWVLSLDGLERVRWFSMGRLPTTPMGRLLGYRLTHVVPGSVTCTMPASQALLAGNGQLVVAPLVANALFSACTTATRPGETTRTLSLTVDAFRPARAQPGNLVARARVVNASRLSVFAETQVEDPEGRSVGHGTMHAALVPVRPAPPPAPESVPRVEEPAYETPDPYLRSFPAGAWTLPLDEMDGLALFQESAQRGLVDPARSLFGIEPIEVELGRVVLSMPASEWFCNTDSHLSVGAMAAFMDMLAWGCGQTRHVPGQRFAALDETMRFLRAVPPDGRRLRGEARVEEHDSGLLVANCTVEDADGHLVATQQGALMRVDGAGATGRSRKRTERILATLLFTDIVASTEHVRRVGDAAWNALLDEHHLAVRRETSRYNGIEVATAGDGIFARFDSPARAIEAARAIRATAARQRLEIRAGIHAGECEIEGNTLAGIAVHLASRIQAAAAPGEILVSSTVHDLVSGGDVAFEDRGEHELKGIEGPRRLFAVADR